MHYSLVLHLGWRSIAAAAYLLGVAAMFVWMWRSVRRNEPIYPPDRKER